MNFVAWMRRILGLRSNPADFDTPSFDEVLAHPEEQESAARYWIAIAAAMRGKGTFSSVTSHAALRLVIAYIVADRFSAAVLRGGPQVDAQVWSTYLAAAQAASQLEQQLGIAPR